MRLALLTLFVPVAVWAAEPTPREQVLNLVPPESSVCFVVQNLRTQTKTVAGSQFAKWATEKIGNKLEDNDDAKRLKQIEAYFTPLLGVSLTDLRDDIFGDCIAFAYEPGPPDQPNAERGVMILYARDPAKLQKLIVKLNEFQKASNELNGLKEHTHAGKAYIERQRANAVSEYYLVHDHIFAFAMNEDSIKGIIDRQAKPQASTVLKDLDDLKLKNAFWACWLSPRKLDGELRAAGAANTPQAAGLTQVAKLWGAVDQCAIYLTASDDLELGVSVTYRAEALPKEVRGQFAAAPAASPLWKSIPADAILAIAGAAEANALIELIGSFLPAAERPKLQQQIQKELGAVVGRAKAPGVLAQLGPEFGVWIEKDSYRPLPAITAALRLRAAPDDSIPATVLGAIDYYAKGFAVEYSRNHTEQMSFEEATIGLLKVRFLSSKVFPNDHTPAYAVKDGYLVAGSHTNEVARFKPPASGSAPSGEVPLVRISANALREQIARHRDGLAKFLTTLNPEQDEAEIRRNLDTFGMVLEALDNAEVVIRGDGRSRTFAVKLKLVKPLK